jgi:hypothetical protein
VLQTEEQATSRQGSLGTDNRISLHARGPSMWEGDMAVDVVIVGAILVW